MGFLQIVTDILESLLKGSTPEVQRKQEIRKLQNELKNFQPEIYKNELLQPNFAELFRVLHEKTKIVGKILSETIASEDVQRNTRFEFQLVLTGFSPSNQLIIESLSYENRMETVKNSSMTMSHVFEMQRRNLESLSKELNTPDFVRIDDVIARLQQLNDICKFNYTNLIRVFDSGYSDLIPGYKPNFICVPVESVSGVIQDFYYLTAEFNLTAAVGRALMALDELRLGRKLSTDETKEIQSALGKINTILTKMLTPAILKTVLRLGKKEPSYEPQVASYRSSSRQKYADYLQNKFTADEGRIKLEIKDDTITSELKELFGEQPLLSLYGYDNETNTLLQQNSPCAFEWITPLQIIKTFLSNYLTDGIKALLDDIVIEGFFENNSLKSEFSSIVYASAEASQEIQEFEDSFKKDEKNDLAIIQGFINDSHRNAEFIKNLKATVDTINNEAHQLVQEVTTSIVSLYSLLGEVLTDSKKASPDTITNIKVLLGSSRNRDNTELLEKSFSLWRLFLDVMKNYAIIGEIEKRNERTDPR